MVKENGKSFDIGMGEPWSKKNGKSFDIRMGDYDGAEASDLVGLYILNKMCDIIKKEDEGLYRDDGLSVLDLPGPEIERIRKKCSVFSKSLASKLKSKAT